MLYDIQKYIKLTLHHCILKKYKQIHVHENYFKGIKIYKHSMCMYLPLKKTITYFLFITYPTTCIAKNANGIPTYECNLIL